MERGREFEWILVCIAWHVMECMDMDLGWVFDTRWNDGMIDTAKTHTAMNDNDT